MRKRILVSVASILALFPVLVLAQGASSTPVMPDPGGDLVGFAGAVFAAFQAKNWSVLIALVLVGVVFLARHYGGKLWPFLGTDRGGALVSLVSGLGLSVFTAATSLGAHSVLQVLGTGLLMTVTASGAYALFKKLVFPSGADQVQQLQVTEPVVQVAVTGELLKSDNSATDLLKDAAK
jgi:hypothetical protein